MEIGTAGVNRDSGSGIVMAYPALTNLSGRAPAGINLQPASQSVRIGSAVTFSVTAVGAPTLAYSWLRNGAFIAGATATSYTTNNVQLSDSGSQFSCVVSNAYGALTSQAAVLTVTMIIVQNGGFETGDFTDWTLSGNTAGTYVTSAAGFVHSGSYGAELGPPGSLGFLSQTLPTVAGSNYLLSLWVENIEGGVNEFQVNWNGISLFNGIDMPAFAWSNMQFTASATSSASVLEFGFRNDPSYFGLDDISAQFSAPAGPVITAQPQNQNVGVGGSATFTVSATGSGPLSYFWIRNTVFIPGATNSTYTTNNVQLSDSGSQFSCLVSNAYNTALSSNALLTVTSLATVSAVAYLRSTVELPWGRSDNEGILTMVFGTNNWQDLRYETVNVGALFSTTNKFIFMEGGDEDALAMGVFLTNNSPAISNWVAAGGSLFLNAAPNVGANIYCGFGVTLTYPDYTDTTSAVNPAHPIFNGPYVPVGASFTGNHFGHATLSGVGLTGLLTNSSDGNFVLAEENYASGHLLFGGMTLPSFHLPQPQATNLLANILAYASSSTNVAPTTSLDHFAWSSIPSPQSAGVAFAASISALDQSNNIVSSFAGSVALTGSAGGGQVTNRMFNGIAFNDSNIGTYTWGYPFTPTNNLLVTHVRTTFGATVSLWTGSGTLLASQNVVSSDGTWTETALAAPVPLVAGSNYVVAAWVSDDSYYWVTNLAGAFPDGTIGTSVYGSSDAFPTTDDTGAWPLVGLRYTVGTGLQIAITPTSPKTSEFKFISRP